MAYRTVNGIPYSFYRSFSSTEAGKWAAFREAAYLRKQGYRARVVIASSGPPYFVVVTNQRRK